MEGPRLRNVDKVKPPYPLGKFPKGFIFRVGREIVYILATREKPTIQGEDWERIFAAAIGAEWRPSNVGLDDIALGVFAWGAKTVKNPRPYTAKTVRLISGRNSPKYSFGENKLDANPHILGELVLEIWNARVESLRNKFTELRTVVLVKSLDLQKFTVFETKTALYPPGLYTWAWNENENLEGSEIKTGVHKFTWQPHGSQFTIVEAIPDSKICFRIKEPKKIDKEAALKALGFDDSWIEIVKT